MIAAVIAGIAAWLVTGDWLIGASLSTLIVGWVALRAREGPPVLAAAFTLQWVAVCIGLFYVTITGRPLDATELSDYRPMVAIGLGCLAALLGGLVVGQALIARLRPLTGIRPDHALTTKTLVLTYLVAVAIVGAVHQAAWDYPSITQALIAITYMRYGLLYLILRRLVGADRWAPIALVLAFEVVLGISGFYAAFREPLIMAVLALLERFDRRNVRHWATIAALGAIMCVLGVLWVGVRVSYRQRFLTDDAFAQNRSQRIDTLSEAARAWASRPTTSFARDVDSFVERLWAIYYPALAVARVPKVVPHADGRIMTDALQHAITPRIFFPDKPELMSDSELVRKYAGVWVAGEEQNTSIAFGYAAESYVDYGVPLMFVPVFVWGVFMGACYAWMIRTYRHRDIAISVATVICWLSLYLFERSWVKTIGMAGTLLIYVGGIAFVLDRLWYEKFRAYDVARAGEQPSECASSM